MSALAETARAPSEWRMHWKMLLACVAGIMLSSVHGYALGVMIAPLEREFGWTRAEISTGPLIVAIVALFATPLIGLAVDRFGPRRIALAGVVLFCAALGMLSTANENIVSWWLLYFAMAAGAMSVVPTIWTAAITTFFNRNRGLALAIGLCGTGIAATIVPRLTYQLVETYGWRGGYVGLAVLFAVIVFPLVFFFFTSASDEWRKSKKSGAAASLPGMQASEAIWSWRYLKLAAAAVIVAYAVSSLITNAVPILMSDGIDGATAASIAGLVGIGAIIGRLCGGYLLDRLDANMVAAVCVLMPIITVALLIFIPGDTFAASAAFMILGLAVGTELDACAYLAARHFGTKSFGALFGIINGLLLFGNGIAPLIANYAYDVTKSYEVVLWALIPACLISCLLFAILGPYPNFDEAKADS